jgi:hypothetical protein
MKKEFINGQGDRYSRKYVEEDVEMSIREMEEQLKQAKDFMNKLFAGTLLPDDEYLSFGQAIEHGYDRTGPSMMSFGNEDEDSSE